jgi:Domain of unknown function (DUF6268)
MRGLFSAICCIITVVASFHALAQDLDEVVEQNGDDIVIAKQRQRPPWESTFETTWLSGSTIHGAGGDLTMREVKAGFTRRFSISPRLELSTGLRYSLREIDAPEAAHLPESLHALSVNAGGEYRTSDNLTLGFRVSPGLSSDFKSFTTNDVRVPVSFHARYQMSKTVSLLGGIAYTGQNHSFPVLPMIGVLYLPSEKWAFALGFPRTGVVYQPNKETELFVAGEFSGGEFRLHDPSIGANIISYRDCRAIAGVAFPLFSVAKLGISGGYAFARKFVFYEGSREDVKSDSTPFGRLEVKFSW